MPKQGPVKPKHRRGKRRGQFQLSGARNALGESYDETRILQAQVQQLQDEKGHFAARLERIEALLASRIPVPSVPTPRQPLASSSAHYAYMAFSPEQASPKATVQFQGEQPSPIRHFHVSLPAEQPVERIAQPSTVGSLRGRCQWRAGTRQRRVSYCATSKFVARRG